MKSKKDIQAQVEPVVISNFIPLKIDSKEQELINNIKKLDELFIESFSIPYELIQPDIRTATEILSKIKYRKYRI